MLRRSVYECLTIANAWVAGQSSGKKTMPEGFFDIKVEEGVAMLVDPINGYPMVFVAPDIVREFKYVEGSGSDHLRQRTLAKMFFDNVVEVNANKQAEKPVYERQRG